LLCSSKPSVPRRSDPDRLADGQAQRLACRGVDAAAIERRLHERLGPDVPTLILAADICRSELLIEIEAVLRPSGATH